MSRACVILAGALLAAGCERAQSKEAPAPTPELTARIAREKCPRVVKPYLYAVSRDGKTSHVLGVRGWGVPLSHYGAKLDGLLRAARVIVIESPAATEQEAWPAGDLRGQLAADDWKRLEHAIGREYAEGLAAYTPGAAAITLVSAYEDVATSTFTDIERKAAQYKIQVTALETVDEQIALIERVFDLRFLKTVLRYTTREQLARQVGEELVLFCSGADRPPPLSPRVKASLAKGGYSADEIARFEREILPIEPISTAQALDAGYTRDEMRAMAAELVDKRARAWADKLAPDLARGDALIAVSFTMLFGYTGVLALLRAQGYTVDRVAW